jgi:DNA-binding transcriptional LysR family regulator
MECALDTLRNMQAFVEVARAGSFVAAAGRLGVSTSSISRLVSDLEAWLKVPLFRRTTRRLSLTDPGRLYLARCAAIVAAADDLKRDAEALSETPRGSLRVTAAASPARYLIAPRIPAFLAAHPAVKLRFDLRDQPIDIVGEGMDLAIRIGRLEDSALVARRIGETRLMLTATPGFLARHGRPAAPGDLGALPCLVDTVPTRGARWFPDQGLAVDGPVFANSGEMIRALTLAGQGLSLLPDFFVREDVGAGRLVSLMEERFGAAIGIYAVFPPRGQITAAARAFVDFIAEDFMAASGGDLSSPTGS